MSTIDWLHEARKHIGAVLLSPDLSLRTAVYLQEALLKIELAEEIIRGRQN